MRVQKHYKKVAPTGLESVHKCSTGVDSSAQRITPTEYKLSSLALHLRDPNATIHKDMFGGNDATLRANVVNEEVAE